MPIGKATVGLIGLDVALTKVLADKNIEEGHAVDLLLEEIRRENYVPDSAIEQYRQALPREYLRLRKGEESKFDELSIRILGRLVSAAISLILWFLISCRR